MFDHGDWQSLLRSVAETRPDRPGRGKGIATQALTYDMIHSMLPLGSAIRFDRRWDPFDQRRGDGRADAVRCFAALPAPAPRTRGRRALLHRLLLDVQLPVLNIGTNLTADIT